MTRRCVAAICVLFALVGAACVRGEPDTPDATPGKVSQDGREPLTGGFEKAREAEIVWQNTVADIEPISRYREEPGGSDVAHITTVMALAEAADGDFEEFLKDLENVDSEISEDGRLVTLRYDLEVPEDETEDDQYNFAIAAPAEFVSLQEDGDVSLTALLPRPAIDYQTGPTYDVELVNTDGAVDAETFESDEESQRIAVFWYKRGDPPWDVVYRLIS